MKEDIKQLKAQSHSLSPVVQIGKNGMTDDLINQIQQLLKKKKLIKVKFLKSYMESNDKKKAAEELVSKTGAVLVHKVGFVVVLYKE